MPIEFVAKASRRSLPVHLVAKDRLADAGLDKAAAVWAEANGFTGETGRVLVLPGTDGAVSGALFGLGKSDDECAALGFGALARALPEGDWHFASKLSDPTLAALGLAFGSYQFTRYGKKAGRSLRVALPKGADAARVERVCDAVFLTRDLVNTPTNDMGPDALEAAVRSLAAKHKAKVAVVEGDALIKQNFPMIHAVGRASAEAPRLIDMTWGEKDA